MSCYLYLNKKDYKTPPIMFENMSVAGNFCLEHEYEYPHPIILSEEKNLIRTRVMKIMEERGCSAAWAVRIEKRKGRVVRQGPKPMFEPDMVARVMQDQKCGKAWAKELLKRLQKETGSSDERDMELLRKKRLGPPPEFDPALVSRVMAERGCSRQWAIKLLKRDPVNGNPPPVRRGPAPMFDPDPGGTSYERKRL